MKRKIRLRNLRVLNSFEVIIIKKQLTVFVIFLLVIQINILVPKANCDMAFTDALGKPVTKLISDSELNCEATVSISSVLVLCLYNKNDKLESITISDKIVNNTLKTHLNLPNPITDHYVKAFLWDSFGSMKSLCKSIYLTQKIMAQYYVAPNGNDANIGTINEPFATIQKARDTIRNINSDMSGDIVVNIKQGDYILDNTMNFSSKDSGTNGFDIVYRNMNDVGSARIIGGKKISGFVKHTDKIYKKDIGVGKSCESLYENGVRGTLARTPNDSYSNIIYTNPDYPKSRFKFPSGDIPQNITDFSNARLLFWKNNNDWDTERVNISSIDLATDTIILSQDAKGKLSVGSRFYIEGVFEFLDSPGEFYYDKKTGWLYYYPRNESINTEEIILPQVTTLLKLAGENQNTPIKNICFEGLDLSFTNFVMDPYDLFANVYITNAKNITVRNCIIKGAGYHGVHLRGAVTYCKMYGNLIEDLGYSGIKIDDGRFPNISSINNNNIISNNIIRNIGSYFGGSAGILISNSGYNVISHNKISNSTRFGINVTSLLYSYMQSSYNGIPVTYENHKEFQQSRHNIIEYNDISSCNLDSQDSGVIYMCGTGKGNVINNNKIYNSGCTSMSSDRKNIQTGIYLDADASYSTIKNNIVYGITGNTASFGGVSCAFIKGVNNQVTNNIFDASSMGGKGIFFYNTADGNNDVTNTLNISKNIFYRNCYGDVLLQFKPLKSDSISYCDDNIYYNKSGQYNMSTIENNIVKNIENWMYDINSLYVNPSFENVGEHNYYMNNKNALSSLGIAQVEQDSIGLLRDFVYCTSEKTNPYFSEGVFKNNLIKNYSFENGLQFWNTDGMVSAKERYSGVSSLLANGAEQVLQVDGGKLHHISAKVKTLAQDDKAILYVKYSDGITEEIGEVNINTNNWNMLSYTYRFSKKDKVILGIKGKTGKIYIDDVFINETQNAIVNGDFESGTTSPWTANSCKIALEQENKYFGNYGLKVYNRVGGTYASPRQKIYPKNQTTYIYCAQVKSESTTDTAILYAETYKNGVVQQYRVLQKEIINNSEYTNITGCYKFNEVTDFDYVSFYIWTSSSMQNFYIDNIFLTEIK